MSVDYVKRYFGKVDNRITKVNESDPFSTSFLSAVNAGNNTLFQKYMTETRVFEGAWVDVIHNSLAFIDNIIRNPKSFIKDQSEIVPVEMAKKTSAESVRHLASHSRYVKTITPQGDVIPEKILTIHREEELAIYENRFVKTLIDKLTIFVEKRYNMVIALIGSDYLNKFQTESRFQFDDINVEYELRLNIQRKVHDSEIELRNYELLKRIEELRSFIMGFNGSPFMKSLKSAKAVYSPIQKTNILTRDPNYRKCYELWMFLDSYGKIEYTIQTSVSEEKIKEEYTEKIKELILLSFATVVANDESDLGRFKEIPNTLKTKRKTKILSERDLNPDKDSIELENHLINEYYYQEARRLYSRRINERVADGEPYHVALKDVYQNAFKITENIFDSLMEMPEDVKKDPVASLRFKMRNQKAIEQILKYKSSDLKKMEKIKMRTEKQIEREKAKLERKNAPKKAGRKKLTEEEKNRRQQEREKQREIARLEKQKEREKEKLQRQKEIERERKKVQKQKERERAKLKALKEKEKARLKALKEKEKARIKLLEEKEKAKLDKLKEREAEKLRKLAEREEQKIAALKAKEEAKLKEKLELEKEKGLEIIQEIMNEDSGQGNDSK